MNRCLCGIAVFLASALLGCAMALAEDASVGQSGNSARPSTEVKLWEPWVDTAAIGDRVIRDYSAHGYREFLEVTAVDKESVTVTVKRAYSRGARRGRSDEIRRLIYSCKKDPALEKFYAVTRPSAKEPVDVKSVRLNCRARGGRVIVGYSVNDDGISIDKTLRCKVWVSEDVPMGGIAKRLLESDSPLGRKGEKGGGPLQLEFVVEDFARGGRPGPSMAEFGKDSSGAGPIALGKEAGDNDKALSAFYSSTKGHVGWRGDGTGRFPDANPSLKWGRISETMKGLRTQAGKPKGEGPGDAKPIPYGTIDEWLVLGPVPTGGISPKKLTKEDLVPDEAKLRPDAGERIGELVWKPVHVEGALLDFNRVLRDARNLKDQAVYAHTYIYAPRASWVFMRMRSAAGFKALVNGEELGKTSGKGTWRVQLNQGWNRILARVLATSKKAGFDKDPWPEGASTFQLEMYGAEKDEKYEETNILWTVEPPQAGVSSWYHPVVVGNRIYVTSSPAFLVCYDKMTGKRLWTRYNGFEEFVTDKERDRFPDLFAQIDPKRKRFRELGESYGGSLDERLELGQLHKELTGLLRKVDPVKYAYPRLQEPGFASQPVSDGKFVYTWCFLGISACYDLDGNRRWMTLENEGPQVKHGYQQAPILIGKDLAVEMQNTIGFDRATGRINWKIPGSGSIYGYFGKVTKGDQTDIVNYDGIGLYKPGLGFFPWSTTTREGNELYRVSHAGIVGHRSRLPDKLTAAPNLEETKIRAWYMPGCRIYLPGLYMATAVVLANPLFNDGLIYSVSTGGVLRVEEYEKHLYVRLLDLNSVVWSYPYPQGAGVCASPTLAGDDIYIFGGNGTTLVIKPGRTYKRVAKNRIERLLTGRLGGTRPSPPRNLVNDRYPECTVSSPIFDGNHLYYRAERYLYCIGEK